jgi:hypothetical protein
VSLSAQMFSRIVSSDVVSGEGINEALRIRSTVNATLCRCL